MWQLMDGVRRRGGQVQSARYGVKSTNVVHYY